MGTTDRNTLHTDTVEVPVPAADAEPTGIRKAMRRAAADVPGVVVCLLGAGVAWLASRVLTGVSALLIAIVFGALWRNLVTVPSVLAPGVGFASKRLLRAGIVLLGLELSLSAVLDLGGGVLLVVVLSVAVTFFVTVWVGKLMGVGLAQRILIATGSSICGAAAVAAAEGAIKAKSDEVATAVSLVVLYGTLMIPLVPFFGGLCGLPDESIGMWIGATTHEVAQVVAAGGAVGSGALAVAVTVKLSRVITLAPIIAGISLYMSRQGSEPGAQKPPLVPLFVVGFIVSMLVRTAGILPESLLAGLHIVQTLLLAAAMFALGLGVHIPSLIRVGVKPLLLGLISTIVISIVALMGTLAFGAS
ncbi:YeiH family protein [Kocuria sp. cx-116]|uniref:YeiH family protein n=1 Tax=Kocuria sp. cx-116 TaxID=2771378 RepID=UPI001CC259B1|nr:putative sulfate exporter family transporter [Kocuria sp. cx-116]